MKYRDILSAETLTRAMGEAAQRYRPHAFAQIDSTNAEAKRLAMAGEKYALICADEQSAGRGRLGRSFHSPSGTGVYLSILHTFSTSALDAVAITSAAAVAVMRAVARVCGRQTDIKWVNDLYRNGKKVAGILAESVIDPSDPQVCRVVLGIGVNLRPVEFPKELAGIATTLDDRDTPRCDLIAAILRELIPFLEDPTEREWLSDYRSHSCVIGRAISWSQNGIKQSGTAVDLDCDGALIVLDGSGARVRLATGEISVFL